LRNTIHDSRFTIKGIAHITGGSFLDKVPRIIPGGLAVELCKNSWPIPKIFQEIKQRANLSPRQMLHTFNMGIGMVLVVSPQDSAKIIRCLKQKFALKSWEIGEIVKGKREVIV